MVIPLTQRFIFIQRLRQSNQSEVLMCFNYDQSISLIVPKINVIMTILFQLFKSKEVLIFLTLSKKT